MNSQRVTMAGWGDASTAATMSTADESLPMEMTIEQHLSHQRSFRQEPKPKPRKYVPTDPEEEDEVAEETPQRNNNKSGRRVIIVLALLVVLCAGTAVGLHLYNQSILDNEQDHSAAAISTNGEGGNATESDTDAPSVSVVTQSPTASPTQAAAVTVSPTQTPPTTSPTLKKTTVSPTLEAIVIDNPLWTNTPSAYPTRRTSAPIVDSTASTPLTPSSAPMVTSTPSLRRPSVAPSAFPTTVATTIATNRQATINPTVPPTVAVTTPPTGTTTPPTTTTEEGLSLAPTGTPSVRSSEVPTLLPTEEPTVDTSLAPTSKPSLRASSVPTTIPTVAPTTLPPTDTPTQESSEQPTTSLPTDTPTMNLVAFRNTPAPTTSSPTSQPTPAITSPPTSDEFLTVVLEPDSRLNRGDFVFSPNGKYRVGLTEIGDLQLVDTTTDELIWNANITGGHRCFLQGDGQCIVRDENGKGLWSTKTSKNNGSQLVLDNGGMLGILYNGSYLWIQGVPRGTYDEASIGVPMANDIQFPIRGAFYYPWYPETWKAGGKQAIFEPDSPLGYYNSANPTVVEAHLDHFEYGNIELGILSWWGQSRNNDRARISLIQNMTQARGSNIKWTVYYEEMDKTKSLKQLIRDLAYMKKWYTWHDTWAKVDGKPVIFVYHNSGCQNTERWMQAANGEWHVVLKLFGGFEDCPVQPSSWHNYGPAREVLYYEGHSFSISPGFWHAAEPEPRLPRVNQTRWCDMVQEMVDSQAPWQLVTTFNEAGEGTMIEPSPSWASDSGYGYYLDCLHQIV